MPGVVTGKPIEIGGSRGRVEATGRGVSLVALEELQAPRHRPGDARVVVQGFGNVGSIAAKMFADRGCKVVGISDVTGGYVQPRTASTSPVRSRTRRSTTRSKGIAAASTSRTSELLEIDCDVLVPAALEKVLTAENAERVQGEADRRRRERPDDAAKPTTSFSARA